MRRILLMALASSALALFAPSAATAAHHGRSRHRAHHAKHRHRSSAAKLLQFGAPVPAPATTGATTQGSAGGSAGAPRTTTTPPAPTEETAGTVKSFTEGVLVITLKDGSTVSGKVTEETELHCRTPGTPGSDDGGGEEGDHGGEGGSPSSGSGPSAGRDARMMGSGEDREGDGSEGDEEGEATTCTTAALVPGAVVREAELSVGSSGAVWDHVDLIL